MVESGLKPFALFELVGIGNLANGVTHSLTEDVIIPSASFCVDGQVEMLVVEEINVIDETYRLRHTAVKLDFKRSFIVKFVVFDAAFSHIGDLNAHLLDDALGERVGVEDGNFVFQLLLVAEIHVGHQGGRVEALASILDDDGARSLVDSRGVSCDDENKEIFLKKIKGMLSTGANLKEITILCCSKLE